MAELDGSQQLGLHPGSAADRELRGDPAAGNLQSGPAEPREQAQEGNDDGGVN